MKCSRLIALSLASSSSLPLLRSYHVSHRVCRAAYRVSNNCSRPFFPVCHFYSSTHPFHEVTTREVPFSSNNRRHFSVAATPLLQAEMIDVTFVTTDGKKLKTKGKIGDNLLDVVVNNNIDLDGFGACEGTLACSTCHLVFKKEDFDKITDKITDEELDMLDLAYGLTDTSRLGCQVTLSKALDGVEVSVPAGVNDARS